MVRAHSDVHFKISLWSNDDDFLDYGVKRFTTAAELLKVLGS